MPALYSMYARTAYEMTEDDLRDILDACKSVPAMMIGGFAPSSPQENANRAWEALGKKMGFDHLTVQPSQGKGQRFFTAVPSETAEAKAERLARDAEKARQDEIAKLAGEISDRQHRLDELLSEAERAR